MTTDNTELTGVSPYPGWYFIDKEGVIHHEPTWDYIKKLQEREQELEEALEFYADKENTCYSLEGNLASWEYWNDGDMDFCQIAKQALKQEQ